MQLVEEITVRPDAEGKPRSMTFCIGNEAMRELEHISGQSAWAVLTDPVESFTRISHLSFCGLAVLRQIPKYKEMTLAQCESQILPHYMTDEWFVFQDAINSLIHRTFPKAAGTRTELQTLRAAQILSSLCNVSERSTGTKDSTPPSNSLECPPESSSSSGTGLILKSC